MGSDDEDDSLANFLESEFLSELSDSEEEDKWGEEEGYGKRPRVEDGELGEQEEKGQRQTKKIRVDTCGISEEGLSTELETEVETASRPKRSETTVADNSSGWRHGRESKPSPKRIDTGIFSHIPPELFYHILKFLSSEDLVSCSLVCRFMNFAASDESLWRRLYSMRWGLLPPKRPREYAWKKLYIKRDEEDMAEFVRNCSAEFREYYIQMQVAKRSQTPSPQVNDDRVIIDKTLTDQVLMWKSSRGLPKLWFRIMCALEKVALTIKLGMYLFVRRLEMFMYVMIHVKKLLWIPQVNSWFALSLAIVLIDYSHLLKWNLYAEQQQAGAADEAEPFMGSGRFARAYILGYNCEDEKELEATLRFC